MISNGIFVKTSIANNRFNSRPVPSLHGRARLRFALAMLIGIPALGPQLWSQCTNLCQQQVTCTGNATTSISGTVYAPNGTDPLPNVLVYVPNAPVQAFTPGVSCELAGQQVSGSPLVSTTTAFDGTFTLNNMPVGTNIPLVIQAGRWRRQFVIPSVSACTNTPTPKNLSTMPSTHAQGDIPLTAIVTGSVDATECALRKIGINDSEFTNPPAQGGTGRINFYLGAGSPGAQINPTTPSETQLEGTQASINQYDLVMFACQGSQYDQKANVQQNLIDYANAGGRIFATHYAYVWLDNDAPFSNTAVWNPDTNGSYTFANDPETGMINTSFSGGTELAEWLQDLGATTTYGQISINTLRHDFDSVVAPSELWLTVNDANLGVVPMQYTFDTPVGQPAASQCGSVVFNDYHVEDIENDPSTGETFPAECVSGAMTPQEKLLEYNLFHLTNFLAPPTPTVSLSFVNSPINFKQGDTSDTITIKVSNTSTQAATTTTLATTVTLPAGLTAVTMTDTTGNWVCNAGTLTCTESAAIAAGASDSIVLTVSVGSTATDSSVSAVVSNGGLAASVSNSDSITILPAGYCSVDADCSSGNWCNETSNACTPTLPNGTPIPTDSKHTNPTLTGTCTTAAGQLVCSSGVCDVSDNKCGYANGDGACTSGDATVVCRSGACSVTDVCEPNGGCEVNADCSAGNVCSSNACVSGCSINGTFYGPGVANPANSCQVCSPATSTSAWSNEPNGTTCGLGGVCSSGTCQTQVAVPNVVKDTLAAATTAITGAGLVVGNMTNAPSATVASGDVISESPTAGTKVNLGSSVNLVISIGATPAALTSPSGGSVLAGPTVTFNWNAPSGATGYGLRLGTTVGGNNLWSSGPITTTSATAKGLPTDGSTVFARLYTNYGSFEVYNDYTFTAATRSALTSPTDTTLAGPTVTFDWSTAPGATGYALRLGNTVGGNNIWSSGPITTTSATAKQLPTNGGTVYARLYTAYGSTEVYTDYTFTATTRAALTSPTGGSVLTGATETFNWNTAAGATGYAIRFGTTVGGNDIWSSGPITATMATAKHLPTNGTTVYARLYTAYGSTEEYTDYTFTAATAP